MNAERSAPYRLLLLAGRSLKMEHDCACVETVMIAPPTPGENDCACTTDLPAPSLPPAGLYHRTDAFSQALIPGFRLALGLRGPCALNDLAWERLEGFNTPHPLFDEFDHRLAAEGLLVGHDALSSQLHPSTLTAWLHLTDRCNLSCPYCYVHKSAQTMCLETGRASLDLLAAEALRGGYQTLKLKYSGGEATLVFNRLRQLHTYAREATRRAGLELSATLLTNGTRLTPVQADWLAAEGVQVMVSVDGVAEIHDRQRSASFARVEHTVDGLLLPRGIRPFISMTITAQNASGAADLARWCIARGAPLSFNFARGAEGLDPADHQVVLAGLRAAYGVFEELLPEQPFLNGLLDRFQAGAHSQTCAAGGAYVVIAPDGSHRPCHMLLDRPAEARSLRNLPVDEKEGCRDCDFRYVCAGGCPLETFRATGAWDQPSPHCAVYRELIPAALRLEGLRLLKTEGYLL